MYVFSSRKKTNFSFLTLAVGLLVFVSMSSAIIKSSAQSNSNQQNPAATFTVTNTNDSGTGSLRQAILNANATAADDVIDFAIPAGSAGCTSGVCTITLTSGELAVNDAATAGTLTITNSTGASNLLISGNNTSRVFFVNPGANLMINGVTITKGNGTGSTNLGYLNFGGGVVNTGTLTLTNSTITSNRAIIGGGIYNNTGTLTLTNSTVSGNIGDGRGGGIYNIGGTTNLTGSTVSGNSASFLGGGIYSNGTLTLTNSTVSGNSASNGGGGIVNNGTTTLTNSTVSSNTATNTTGGIINSGTLNLASVTVTQNKSTSTTFTNGAGGIYNFSSYTANLNNTIVAGNTVANASSSPDFRGAVAAGSSYNLIGNGFGTTGITNGDANGNQVGVDPLLDPTLQLNGGTTENHALLAGSPAINAGNNAKATEPTDQRGFARIVGGIIDIGAFEVQTVTCDFTINPINQAIGSSGGNVTVNITGENGCSRTAVSNANWITVTSGGSGSASGTVTLSVQANTGSARTGTATIAGQTFTVTQASGCTFSFSPTSATVSGFAGTGSFNVISSGADCSYSAVSNDSFITIVSGASGTGNGTISYSIAANTTGAARTGTITAGGQTFTITQATLPTLTINSVTLNEGNSGTTAFTFTVSLSAASNQTVSVNFATTNGTAIAGEDYTAANGTVTFKPGEVNKTLTVQVNGDTLVEGNETFTVNLSNASNAVIAVGQGIGTILNDDTGGSIQFSLSNFTVNENAGTATITVTRTGGAASGVTINYSTSDGTATAGQDYTAASGTLTFAANETSQTFTIPIINDSINEANETVNITLSNPGGGGTIGTPATAVLTIIDDDGAPTLSISNVSANEGNSGTTAFTFTVSLLGASSQTVTVNYATANGTAVSPSDYQATSGSLSFAAGETSKTITVLVNGDTEVEPNETFTVNLTNATNATIANGVGTGTIQNDDNCSYSISPTSINANANGSSGNTITVTTQAGCAYTAVSNASFITINSGASGTGNGIVTFTVAANTGAARTGTILVAGQIFTVNQAAATAVRRTAFDFDGDGKADISVFRPSNGVWYLNQTTGGFTGMAFGQMGDKIVPADYDGDGKTDIAVYRSGIWYLQRSSLGFTGIAFGAPTDIPVPADFDGDGKAELAVFRPSNGVWYQLNLANNQNSGVAFGQMGDKPIPADYDGDGKADIAVYRAGIWYLQRSTLGFLGVAFGDGNDKPVPADYDGDGKTDIAVFRPSNGVWYLNQSTAGITGIAFGLGTDLPTPADYDGDGKADVSVFRNGTWYLQQSTAGFTGVAFGENTDLPTPNSFVP